MLSKTLLKSALLMALPLGAMLPGCGGGGSSAFRPAPSARTYTSALAMAPGQLALLSLRVQNGAISGTLKVPQKSAASAQSARHQATPHQAPHKTAAGADETSEEPTEKPDGEEPGETPTGEAPDETPEGENPEGETPVIQTATGGAAPAFSFAIAAGTYSLGGTMSSPGSFRVSGNFPGSVAFSVEGQIPADGGSSAYTLTSGGETLSGEFTASASRTK